MTRIAAFLGESYLEAGFMSARKLAAATGVSLATVVRFSRVLGYPTFEAFRLGIQERVNFALTGVERLRTLPSQSRSPAALLRRVVDADVASLRGLAQTFSETDFDDVVNALLRARRITVVGFRYTSPLAAHFAYSLGKVKDDVASVGHADSSLYDRVRLMGADDLLVAVALARYPSDLVAVARYARRLHRRLVAITDSALSPLVPLADASLYAKTNMLDFVGSLAAPAALINCLVSEVSVRLGDRAIRRLEAIEDAAREAGIYVRGPWRVGRAVAVDRRRPRARRETQEGGR